MLFVTNIHCTITDEDDSNTHLLGRKCTRMQQHHPQILHKYAPRAHDISGIAFSNAGARFAASAAQPGIWRCAAKLHRNAKPCMTRGAPRANIVSITDAGSVLEGAASKAHLSPTHGTRAARELIRGRAWLSFTTDTKKSTRFRGVLLPLILRSHRYTPTVTMSRGTVGASARAFALPRAGRG